MALDTKLEIEEDASSQIANARAERTNESDMENNSGVFIHIGEDFGEGDENMTVDMKMTLQEISSGDLKFLEDERLFDETEKKLLDTFIYHFQLSNDQSGNDVTEESNVKDDKVSEPSKSLKRPLKQPSTESDASMDDAIKRVLAKVAEIKVQRRKERKKRERLKCLHLVVAVFLILLLAFVVVGIRVRFACIYLIFDRFIAFIYCICCY